MHGKPEESPVVGPGTHVEPNQRVPMTADRWRGWSWCSFAYGCCYCITNGHLAQDFVAALYVDDKVNAKLKSTEFGITDYSEEVLLWLFKRLLLSFIALLPTPELLRQKVLNRLIISNVIVNIAAVVIVELRWWCCISVGYTMDTVYFSWLETPVDIDKGLQLPQFTLEKTTLYDCSQNYTAGLSPFFYYITN